MFSPKPQKMPKRNIAPAAPVMNGGGGDEPPSLFVPATDATCSYPARNTTRNTVTFKKQRRNRRRSRRN